MDESDDGRTVPPRSTGISGLDDILNGGFPANQLYLLEGSPGTGKTTLALQFLMEGVRQGETVLYVTLSETRRELLAVGRSHGWSLDGLHIHEMEPLEESLSPDHQLTMFHPSELELTETTQRVLRQVEELKPSRVVFDSLSEMRLLAQSSLRYRRQILALKQFFAGRQATVLLLDDLTGPGDDQQLQSICHGVVRLEQLATEYGAERRRLRVLKLRATQFRGGLHDFVLRKGGLDVFPRLVASEHHADFSELELSSGNPGLDRLLGGGLQAGSSTLLVGPAGTGKSSVCMSVCIAAAARGERSALFLFDETISMLKIRSRSLGLPVDTYIDAGLITLRQIEPAELSPGEFAASVRRAVEGKDDNGRPAKLVVIDSLNGYLLSMAEEKQLTSQLHELFKYTSQQGALAIVTLSQAGMVGPMSSPVDSTYLADTVILFRNFESFGHLRRAISVIKKRSGPHELTLREFRLSSGGLSLSEPLEDFQGVLTGVPTYHGKGDRGNRNEP
ncbi:MAG TPA: ATPase domain-containing protein [Thermoanaerobaculia bacterium]|nr:ATPase domain-containing protein [Thermoanaerobaculia bacterium]